MKKLIFVILVLFFVTGCAVYGPPPAPAPYYYGGPYPYYYNTPYPYYGYYGYRHPYYGSYGYRYYGY